MEKRWRSLPTSQLTRGEKVCKFIEKECRVPAGKKALIGKPVDLADFQVKFILDVYDNRVPTSMAILSIARKNAKTATIAFLLLVHLVGPEAIQNSEIGSGARSRDQASQVFKYAWKVIKLNPKLAARTRVIPSQKMIIGLPMNVEYKALSAEAGTSHGMSLVVAILDEVGQIRGPYDEFVDAVTTSQGAYDDPILFVISTQAPNDGDLLSIWIDDAKKSGDESTVCHVYEVPVEQDKGKAREQLTDEACWYLANPALGNFRSLDDLRKQAAKAVRIPTEENKFRNLGLNQRVSVHVTLVPKSLWEACDGQPAIMVPGTEVWAGIDLSMTTDLTAMLVVFWKDGSWQIHSYFWAPEDGLHDRVKRDRVPYDIWAQQGILRLTPGKTVGYDFVAKDIAEILGGMQIREIAFDRYRIKELKNEFDAIGFDLTDPSDQAKSLLREFGQGYKDMGPAVTRIETELLNARLRHGGNPLLTMCASNAVVLKDPAGNRKFDKAKATGRIDGFVALTMAISRAVEQCKEALAQRSVYEDRGVLVF